MPFPRLPRSIALRYAIALVAFAVSLLLRGALDAWLSPDRGFILFLPAAILTTFFAGLGPAILTAVLSALALWFFFLPPYRSFALDPEGAVGLATFVLATGVSITLVHWLRIVIMRLDAERARAEDLVRERERAEARLARDLVDMTRLNQLTGRLAREDSAVDEGLSAIVEAAIAVSGAIKGNAQLFVSTTGGLTIAAQHGFDDSFLSFFAPVREDASACSTAMRSGERVIVEDVLTSEIFVGQAAQKVLLDAGVRAVVSTPIMSSARDLLGMVSVHFEKPHRPSERELRLLDLLTRQAADYLERVRAQRMEKTLIAELEHRSNNLLSVVQAIAAQTISGEARNAFEARLHALARSNRQLFKSNWRGVNLIEVVRFELQPFAERTIVEGADVVVGAEHAQNLSLALHELATNAAKYGALSNPTGTVRVYWTIASETASDTLRFRWHERGGPPVVAPRRRGFGTSLLRAVFADVRLDYASEGLNCEFELRLDRVEPAPTEADAPREV